MPARDVDELGVTARGPERGGVAKDEEHQTSDPKLKAQPYRRGQRPVSDGNGARDATHEDLFVTARCTGTK